MSTHRTVFMGSGSFALPVLEYLLRYCPVAAVYTQPDRPVGRGRAISPSEVKKLALDGGLPVFQPPSLKPAAEVERLRELKPDAIVVASYGLILKREVLSLPPFGCINIHPSLLPRHRGPSPIVATLLAGDRVTGVSIMLMEEGTDTGPVLARQEEAVLPGDTAGSLTARLAGVAAKLLEATLPQWFAGRIKPQQQDDTKATYSSLITKEDGELNWRLPAVEMERQVRAYDPWPGTSTTWEGRRLKVLRALPLPGKKADEAGRVVALHPDGAGTPVGVQTGDGVLGLLELQLEGKRPLAAVEFVRGQRGFTGALLRSRAD
ncbi:MAG: methionyl-tRNA formyltransferase [Dehalococcoidia bacterium]|nr:methionyl-tRNA formyltransferase [Dehalococcoidia bacterium]